MQIQTWGGWIKGAALHDAPAGTTRLSWNLQSFSHMSRFTPLPTCFHFQPMSWCRTTVNTLGPVLVDLDGAINSADEEVTRDESGKASEHKEAVGDDGNVAKEDGRRCNSCLGNVDAGHEVVAGI